MTHVRELPPLRLHVEAVTPKGNRYRWGDDERNPANIPSGLSFSSTMPGGYEQLDVSLARRSGVDYSDLDRLSTLRVRGSGGDIAWEGRLERTPRVSGDQMAISPSAVGWQAHLEDDKSAQVVYIDRNLGSSGWREGSTARKLTLFLSDIASPNTSVSPDSSGDPAFLSSVAAPLNKPYSELWYDAGGARIGQVMIGTISLQNLLGSDTNVSLVLAGADDDTAGGQITSGELRALTSTTYTLSPVKRYAFWRFRYNGATGAGVVGQSYGVTLANVAIIGDHGLTLRGTGSDAGYYASDIVTHAVSSWAPLLRLDGSVQASSFVIPHLAFLDSTTAGEIIRQATAYGLQDWAVWENRTFYWAQRGTYGRRWRTRIAPAQLSETGPQLDRLWNSVIVSYQDVDGSMRTVGPVGSGADLEDDVLHDSDPENPANQLGIIRRELLTGLGTSTAAGAVEVGRRFLEEQKFLDTSGQAQLIGHVTDDHGVVHPYWRVRAGDQISFTDAADTSYRRVVRASHDHGSRTCTVDLDAPPEGLDALLARLGVVLVPLGVSS